MESPNYCGEVRVRNFTPYTTGKRVVPCKPRCTMYPILILILYNILIRSYLFCAWGSRMILYDTVVLF